MWTIKFKGFFQCRLATDPDDTDDPRGQNGWTFAYGGEPNLDRVIRFQNPSAPRSFAPAVGVAVVGVNGNAAHALVGAQVSLLMNAMFEGRNGLIATPGHEPIAPFVVQLKKGPFQLMRHDDYVVTDVNSRKPHMGQGVTQLSTAEQAAIGIQNPVRFRGERRVKLETALQSETDAVKRANLTARIEQLKNFSTSNDIQLNSLTFKVPYAHQLRHHGAITDSGRLLPGVNLAVPWDISYWMGAWDADALQGFVDGTLSIATV